VDDWCISCNVLFRQLFGDYFDGNSLDTVDASIGCIFIKDLILDLDYCGIDWSIVDFWLRNMCLTRLVRIGVLDLFTIGLLSQYMNIVIDLYKVRICDDLDR